MVALEVEFVDARPPDTQDHRRPPFKKKMVKRFKADLIALGPPPAEDSDEGDEETRHKAGTIEAEVVLKDAGVDINRHKIPVLVGQVTIDNETLHLIGSAFAPPPLLPRRRAPWAGRGVSSNDERIPRVV